MVVFEQNWLYSGKNGCIRQSGCLGAKVVVIGQSGCVRGKFLYSGKVVVFGQKLFCWCKVVVFG